MQAGAFESSERGLARFAGRDPACGQPSPLLRLRHRHFIAAHLGLAGLVLVGAPVYALARGAPDGLGAAMFLLALAPGCAAALVAFRGSLVAGHAVAALGLLGMAMLAAGGAPGGSLGACGCLVAAASEAIASGDNRLRRMACIALLLAMAYAAAVAPGAAASMLLVAFAATATMQATLRTEAALRATNAALTAALACVTTLEAATRAPVIDADPSARALCAPPGEVACPGQAAADASARRPFELVPTAESQDASGPDAGSQGAWGHEWRAPLNAIIGFSDLLASRTSCPHDPEVQRGYARIIQRSGQHLSSLVEATQPPGRAGSGPAAPVVAGPQLPSSRPAKSGREGGPTAPDLDATIGDPAWSAAQRPARIDDALAYRMTRRA